MTEATLKDFCKDGNTLNQKAYNAIQADLEGKAKEDGTTTPVTYYTKIKYTWG